MISIVPTVVNVLAMVIPERQRRRRGGRIGERIIDHNNRDSNNNNNRDSNNNNNRDSNNNNNRDSNNNNKRDSNSHLVNSVTILGSLERTTQPNKKESQ